MVINVCQLLLKYLIKAAQYFAWLSPKPLMRFQLLLSLFFIISFLPGPRKEAAVTDVKPHRTGTRILGKSRTSLAACRVQYFALELNPSGAEAQNSTPSPPLKKKRGDTAHIIRPRFESDRLLSQRANQSNECLPNQTTNELRTTALKKRKKERPPKNKLEIFFVFHLFLLFFFFLFFVFQLQRRRRRIIKIFSTLWLAVWC